MHAVLAQYSEAHVGETQLDRSSVEQIELGEIVYGCLGCLGLR